MTFQPINGVRAGPRAAFEPPVDMRAGGPYGWLTPAIAAIANHDPAFARRALFLTRKERHAIALILALMGERGTDPDHLAAFARDYGRLDRRTLLAAMAPGRDAAVMKLVSKLAGAPWRAPTYRRLADLFADKTARKVLRHLPAITRRHVLTLARLPDGYRTISIVRLVAKPRQVPEVVFAIDLVRRLRTDLTDRQIIASLERADGSRIRAWVMRHYERAPFPPAPTEALMRGGVEVMRPLTTYEDLATAAREFDNCIRTYHWNVLKGDTYFYRYAPEAGGKGVAIVELRRLPAVGWVVHEALGPNNGDIPAGVRASILALFRQKGVGAAPQAANPDGPWFNID